MPRPYLALAAGILMTATVGSVHAFSVFIQPLEQMLGVARAQVSLLYSGALISLTLTVLVGYVIYPRVRPATLALLTCVVAAVGLMVFARGESLLMCALGYSVLFGGASGLGYGFSLHAGASALPHRKGFAIGAITAASALGAVGFAKFFDTLIASGGISRAGYGMALVLLGTGVASAILLRAAGLQLPSESDDVTVTTPGWRDRLLWLLWGGYCLSTTAGLMAIGHAATIVGAAGGRAGQLVAGAMLIGLGNAVGGFLGGWAADRWSIRNLLMFLTLISAAMLFLLATSASPIVVIAGLTVIGFAYGAIVGVYPVAVAVYYGARQSARMFGRVFTAWAVAGLTGPWFAGLVYDMTGGYAIALVLAGVAVLVATIVCAALPQRAA